MEDSQENRVVEDTTEVKEIKKDLGDYMAVEGLVHTEGGKVLVENLKLTIAANVEAIISLLKEPDIEIRCAIAKLAANLNLYRALKRAPENAKLAKEELSKLLEEDRN